jgi:hypothetical protein
MIIARRGKVATDGQEKACSQPPVEPRVGRLLKQSTQAGYLDPLLGVNYDQSGRGPELDTNLEPSAHVFFILNQGCSGVSHRQHIREHPM